MSFWDYLIITASSSVQAETFRFYLDKKQADGVIPKETTCMVIPDGEGSIGSGGSFFGVLRRLSSCGVNYENNRILLIQCGGESRRVPQYSVCGKLFAPALRNPSGDFFDELFTALSHLCREIQHGLVVSTSDILVHTDGLPNIRQNTVFALRAPATFGERHGVFCTGDTDVLEAFHHKKPISALRQSHAVLPDDSVLLDTGLVYFDPPTMNLLSETAKQIPDTSTHFKLNFYSDIIGPMALSATEEAYLSTPTEFGTQEAVAPCRTDLYQKLRDVRIHVQSLSPQPFCHIGTPSDLLQLKAESGVAIQNSIVEPGAEIGEKTIIENCIIRSSAHIGRHCILSDLVAENVTVPDYTGVYCVQLKNGNYVAAVYRTDCTSAISDEDWALARFSESESRAEAVQSALSSRLGTHSKKSILELSNPQARNFWREYVHSRICTQAFEDARKKIISLVSSNRDLPPIHFEKESAQVDLPVRINFAGTWTDAAPFCLEHGGAVCNVPITLNGIPPIHAKVLLTPKAEITLCCADFNMRRTMRYSPALYDFESLRDPYALHKAALIVSGIIPPSFDPNFRFDRQYGCGLDFTTCAENVPQGSGLGTSSLLLAASIQALFEITGRTITHDELFRSVFAAEQLIRTGGGWQDQVGGIVPGFKLIQSQPGIPQNLSVRNIRIEPSVLQDLRERAVLIYTGERHYGRFILSDIMARYKSGETNTLSALQSLKSLAIAQEHCFDGNNLQPFTDCLGEHFSLLRKLSPKIITPKMHEIYNRSSDLLCAFSPCGAGGGGFCLAILKKAEDISPLNQVLKDNFTGTEIVPFDFVL